jgi:hypothetical protein
MPTFDWEKHESRFRDLEKEAGGRLEARYSSERGGQWILCGPASEKALITTAFTALAELGAVAAGKPGGLKDWLDLLRLEGDGLFPRSYFSVEEPPLKPDDPAAARAKRGGSEVRQRSSELLVLADGRFNRTACSDVLGSHGTRSAERSFTT